MAENKISGEMAEQEFDRFAEAMDLEFDTSNMDPEDVKGFDHNKSIILKAIQKGALIIDEKGQPVYTPQRTSDVAPIVFHEPTGASLMAMDGGKKTEDVKKLYHVMADVTERDAKLFSSMKMADLKVCMAVITLFLG
jgi:hypothetical protein